MINKAITQEQLKAHYEGTFRNGNAKDILEKEVITEQGNMISSEKITYQVEGTDMDLFYSMGQGWVLKSDETVTLKEYFDKAQFDQEQKEKEEKKEVENEIAEMTDEELLEACGGYNVLQKLLKGKTTHKEAIGEYQYKSITVLKITENTFWFYRGNGSKEFSDNLNTFCAVLGLKEMTDVPYDAEIERS